jgi:tetratricopeptide (TPR) repeat protein
MQRLTDARIWGKLLVVFVFIAFLGVSARSHQVMALMWQAQSALSYGAHQEAADKIALVADQIPWRSDLWELAGRQAMEANNYNQVIIYLEKAAKKGSLSREGYLLLAEAYQHMGQLKAATQSWNTAIQMGAPQFDTLNQMLQAQLFCQDYDGALDSLYQLVKLEPLNASLQYRLGMLLATRQPGLAISHLLQVADIDPTRANQANLLSGAIQSALNNGESAYLLVVSGRALASLDEWSLAAEAFRQASLRRPDYAEAWAFWGEALQRQGVQSNGQSSSGNNEDHPADCPCCGNSSADDDPFLILRKAISLDPASLSANTLMALYWQRHNDYTLAVDYLKKASNLDPQNPVIQAELGDALALDGDLQAALEAFQRASQLAPGELTFLKLLVNFTVKYHYRVQETGLPAARKAITQNPKDTDCLDLMGQIFFQLEELHSAEVYFKRAIELDPEDAAVMLHLGQLYLQLGQASQAQALLSQAQALAPGTTIADAAWSLLQANFP